MATAAIDITACYSIMELPPGASDTEITASYKRLARQYHPDKNPGRLEWAHEKMTALNHAYSLIMGHRFENQAPEPEPEQKSRPAQAPPRQQKQARPAAGVDERMAAITRENSIKSFIKIRESVNDSLYRFFQYQLYNIIRREKVSNRGIFNEIVFNLRRSYHAVKKVYKSCDDKEVRHHLTVFNDMIFNFYKAAECLNVIDSYNNVYEVEAYRQYKKGDDLLHSAHKEIFYDRHNRGFPRTAEAMSLALKSQNLFGATLKLFPDSSWAVETKIKLAYAGALIAYIDLFFSEEE